MKKAGTLLLMFFTTYAFGQNTTGHTTGDSLHSKKWEQADTTLKVYYAQNESNKRPPAYYLNGKWVHHSVIGAINPHLIRDVHIASENVHINGVDYYGKVQIKTKDNYEPQKLMTLNELKKKYTKVNNQASLFMIDDNLIKEDADNYWVDESYLLSITVDQVKNPKENLDLALIKILTKSEKNKKEGLIRLRGADDITSK